MNFDGNQALAPYMKQDQLMKVDGCMGYKGLGAFKIPPKSERTSPNRTLDLPDIKAAAPLNDFKIRRQREFQDRQDKLLNHQTQVQKAQAEIDFEKINLKRNFMGKAKYGQYL
jgi:hypothetical protein